MLNLTGLETDTSQEELKMRKHPPLPEESDKATYPADMKALDDYL